MEIIIHEDDFNKISGINETYKEMIKNDFNWLMNEYKLLGINFNTRIHGYFLIFTEEDKHIDLPIQSTKNLIHIIEDRRDNFIKAILKQSENYYVYIYVINGNSNILDWLFERRL